MSKEDAAHVASMAIKRKIVTVVTLITETTTQIIIITMQQADKEGEGSTVNADIAIYSGIKRQIVSKRKETTRIIIIIMVETITAEIITTTTQLMRQ